MHTRSYPDGTQIWGEEKGMCDDVVGIGFGELAISLDSKILAWFNLN